MEFPKLNYPISLRRTTVDIPKLCDDYGCYKAVSFESSKPITESNQEPGECKFQFKRIPGRSTGSTYIAYSPSLPLLHPDEDPGIPDVTFRDLFHSTKSTDKCRRPIEINRAAQQATYFLRNYPEVMFESCQVLLKGCFRTKNKKRKKKKYKMKYKGSSVGLPMVVGSIKPKKLDQLLGDVLCDISPDLLQTLLHEEIESLSKKIVHYPLYCGGSIVYQQMNSHTGIILSACGPPMDVLKIQPISIITQTKPSSSVHPTISSQVEGHSTPPSIPVSSPCDIPRSPLSAQTDGGSLLTVEEEPQLFTFQGVIRQIVSSKVSTQETVYIAIRTDYQCHVMSAVHECAVLKLKMLETVGFQHRLTSIALSPYIPGECLITLENGAIDMITKDSGVQSMSAPMFEGFAGSVWRQCHYGSHPRLLVSTEHTKVDLIDVKIPSGTKETNLFQLPSIHVTANENILVARQHPSNYFQHFIATHHQVYMFDERFPQMPILEWNNLLKTPPNYLDIFAPLTGDDVVVVGTYASCEVHCFQYQVIETNPACPVGTPWKVASVIGWLSLLPSLPSSSHTLEAASKRLKKPFHGVCTIAHNADDNPAFTVLMMNSVGDVFYQTYISANDDERQDKTLHVGPGCPSFKLHETSSKKCYDWLDALTVDYQRKPLDDGCLTTVKGTDVSDLVNELRLAVKPNPECSFCHQDANRTEYDNTKPTKCPACGMYTDISCNLLGKYCSACGGIVTKHSLGLHHDGRVDQLLSENFDVTPGGDDDDEVGCILWKSWKSQTSEDEHDSQQSYRSTSQNAPRTPSTVITRTTSSDGAEHQQVQTDPAASQDILSQLPTDSQDPDAMSQKLSQDSVDLFSQMHSQPSQSRRTSQRTRRQPAKLRGVMGF